MSVANLHVLDAYDRWVPVRGGSGGSIGTSGGGGLPAGQPTVLAPWSYAAAAGGITNTSDVTLKAAAGAGQSIYVTSVQVQNTSATATELILKSGATILWRCSVSAASGPITATFERPLIVANNTALVAACVTNATVTYVNVQGYADETIESLNAEQTAGEEIFDEAGDQIFDAASAAIYM